MQNIKRAIPVTVATLTTLAESGLESRRIAIANEWSQDTIGKVLESGKSVAFDGDNLEPLNRLAECSYVDKFGQIKMQPNSYMVRVECVKWIRVEITLDAALLIGNAIGVSDSRIADDAPSTDAPSTDAPSTDAPKRRGRPRKNA